MDEHLNDAYRMHVDFDHQRRYAQYFTPHPVASFMIKWLLQDSTDYTVFDPAFGLGAFFYETPENVHFSGMEADPCILEFFEKNGHKKGASVSCGDYLLSFGRKYNAIVCNPPYLRFQKIEKRKIIFQRFKEELGIALSGYTNIASAFLAKSLRELSDNGKLAYIMPWEFLNTGYGTTIKKMLLDRHTFSILRINCEKDVFPDATTSVCIILYDKGKYFDNIKFYSIDSLYDLDKIHSLPPAKTKDIASLNPENKWGVFFEKNIDDTFNQDVHWVPLNFYGRFSRGIATGANEFFVLSPSEIQRLNLLKSDYSLCVSKSSQVTEPVFQTENIEKLLKCDSKIFLFSPQRDISESAGKYIHYGEDKEYHKRYLLQHRNPWYKTESRELSPIFLNVFSRGSYKVIKNETNAVSLTCFHNFYPNMLAMHLADVLFLFLYSSIGHAVLTRAQRQYGDHLNKFEPNDLNNALVPSEDYFQKINPDRVALLIDNLRHGRDVIKQIDALFANLIVPEIYPFRNESGTQHGQAG